MSEEDKRALEYAVKRLGELGFVAFTDIEKAVEQLGKAFADQKIVVCGHHFRDLIDIDIDMPQVIEMREHFDHTPMKEHGAYRQFEKRDKRKNYRR